MAENGLNPELLILAGSAGSLDVLLNIVPHIKRDISFALLIVVHRKMSPDSVLSELLTGKTALPVKEIEDKEPVSPGCIYIAPPDYHVLCENDRSFSLDFSEKVNYSRPSIDVAFESASEVYGPKLICFLLSGANNDGMAGLQSVKDAGGYTVVQAPESAQVPFMPAQAILHVKIDRILNVSQMVDFINSL